MTFVAFDVAADVVPVCTVPGTRYLLLRKLQV